MSNHTVSGRMPKARLHIPVVPVDLPVPVPKVQGFAGSVKAKTCENFGVAPGFRPPTVTTPLGTDRVSLTGDAKTPEQLIRGVCI